MFEIEEQHKGGIMSINADEKGQVTDVHKILEQEVFGFDSERGSLEDPGLLTRWGIKIRAFAKRFGVEENGIERIPAEARVDQSPFDQFSFFSSANVGMSTIVLGALGPSLFALGWWDSFLAILFFNLIGALAPALIIGLGPKLGLRTMTIPRYSFGWWPTKVLAFVNLIAQLGWALVNNLAGSQLLYDVSDEKLPLSIAVLIVSIASFIIGLFGYRVIHIFDKYSYIVMYVCFIIVAGFGGKHFYNAPMPSGTAEAANILTFGTAIIGYEFAWLPMSADYCTYMKEDVPAWKPVTWAYVGFATSQIFIEWLAAALALTVIDPDFQAAYDTASIGGLIGQVFQGYGAGVAGFGKFIMVILAFSTIPPIVVNIYSLGLSAQVVSLWALKIPRLVWSILGTIVFTVAAMVGRDELLTIMNNFLLMLAYWLTPFIFILAVEHWWFRRHTGYDLDAWNKKNLLPIGIAASVTFLAGFALGMVSCSQAFLVGPLATAIAYNNGYGVDISWLIQMVFSTVLYVPLRYWELKKFKR